MNNKFVLKAVIAAVFVLFFASCDKDYDQIGTGIVGEDHFDFDKYTDAGIIAYNKLTCPVQTNNLALNQLGYISNPVFGNTTANFVSQLTLVNVAPAFGANVAIDSVYFSLPYFNHKNAAVATTSDGVVTYVLDSVQRTAPAAKFNLSIYENGYYLNDFDPASGFEQAQRFYNTQDSDFDSRKKGIGPGGTSVDNGTRLNNGAAVINNWPQNDGFFIDQDEIVTKTTGDDNETVRTRTVPGMRIKLDNDFFMKKIFNAPAEKLASNAAFRDYFRGLYFKVTDPDAGVTNLAQLNFAKGVITIYYKEDLTTTPAGGVPVTTRVNKTLALNLTGNTVNLLSNSANAPYLANIPATPNITTGDSKLYLKGGEGSMAFINLFTRPGELELLKKKQWLINEASLTFYLDNEQFQTSNPLDTVLRPRRIYLYDATNNRVLYDYSADASTYKKSKFNQYTFGGSIDRRINDSIKYKLRITNHIRRILRENEENVTLGLVVTEAISDSNASAIQTPFNLVIPEFETVQVKKIPTASVMHPFGLSLYGTNLPENDVRRLKLEIYYTDYQPED
ncbi:DUF4270 domain-containing protein [Flavobacterium sp. 3HN19-14]|uniref:DUF4270 domain-containing protein n=1 Tax=Flavobacterium sp. 3HN19-14 TaxID=3448133 RepID=UPI003EE2A9F6